MKKGWFIQNRSKQKKHEKDRTLRKRPSRQSNQRMDAHLHSKVQSTKRDWNSSHNSFEVVAERKKLSNVSLIKQGTSVWRSGLHRITESVIPRRTRRRQSNASSQRNIFSGPCWGDERTGMLQESIRESDVPGDNWWSFTIVSHGPVTDRWHGLSHETMERKNKKNVRNFFNQVYIRNSLWTKNINQIEMKIERNKEHRSET